MKKTWKIAALLLGIASFGLAGCEKPEDGPGKEPGQEGSGIEKPVDPDAGFTSVGTVKLADLAPAVEAFNSAWEEDFTVPSKISVDGKELTIPQYQYAFCKALVNIAAGIKDDINVLSFKEIYLDDDDDYDKASMPLKNGPSVGIQTEDLVNVASRMIAMMRKSQGVPESVMFVREHGIAYYGALRATVTIARALKAYFTSNALPEQVETRIYPEQGPVSIGDFARSFVKVLDVWQANVGTIYADGKHSGSNAFKNVHFIPTVSSYAESDNSKLPATIVRVGGNKYTLYQAWELAIRGIIDLITVEGSSKLQVEIGTPVHTPGDGATLDSMLPSPSAWEAWTYPWYEADATLNLSSTNPVTMPLLLRLLPWWYKRANDFGYVGNFQYLHSFEIEGFTGMICSMRCLLIMARFYKAVLDAGITSGVYTYMKDKTIDPDLYGKK